MYTKDDVAALVAELDKREIDPPVVTQKYAFDLGLDLFDPVSGQIITACRPHRRDIGEEEIRLTADQVVAAVAQARRVRALEDRAKGIVPPVDAEAAEKRQKTALAEKEARLAAEAAGAAATKTMPHTRHRA